jgi:CheY-like chemotaxis protein
MKLQNSMEPTLLIVEDVEKTLIANERYINQIEADRKDKAGIAEFKIDRAISVEVALACLTRNISSPYDIVLLDMNLPGSSDDRLETGSYANKEDREYRGYEILDFIENTSAARAVIVVSAHPVTLLNVFRQGAFDFIKKPRYKEELQERVLVCWTRLLLIKSKQIFDARIGDLVPYAEKGLAHRFTTCFYNLVQTVAHSTEDIEKYMQERYGLDRRKDSQDYLFKCLQGEEEAVARIQKEWTVLQAAVMPQEESSTTETIDALLIDIQQGLRPCLIVKNVELELLAESATEILSFDDDVRAILKEIIVGALVTLQDFSEIKQTISINIGNVIGNASGQVKVSFADQLKPISPEDAERINEGSNISPSRRFEREWGLSVVQHIAMRGGGRLEVEPQAQGNVVAYFVPSAR